MYNFPCDDLQTTSPLLIKLTASRALPLVWYTVSLHQNMFSPQHLLHQLHQHKINS